MILTRRPGTIYISDLAQLYFPKSTPRSAVTQFQRWIKHCKPLQQRLEELSYAPYQRAFTPKQHQAVIDMFGEP